MLPATAPSYPTDSSNRRFFDANCTVVARAVRIARRRTSLSEEDLRAVAELAMCSAAASFDPSRGVPFAGYAWTVVTRQLGKAIRTEHRHQRGRVGASWRNERNHSDDDALLSEDVPEMVEREAGSAPLGRATLVMAAQTEEMAVQRAHHRSLVEALRATLGSLPQRPRRLLEMRYLEGQDFDPIASALGVSNASVRRHHVEALRLVLKRLRARGLVSL